MWGVHSGRLTVGSHSGGRNQKETSGLFGKFRLVSSVFFSLADTAGEIGLRRATSCWDERKIWKILYHRLPKQQNAIGGCTIQTIACITINMCIDTVWRLASWWVVKQAAVANFWPFLPVSFTSLLWLHSRPAHRLTVYTFSIHSRYSQFPLTGRFAL